MIETGVSNSTPAGLRLLLNGPDAARALSISPRKLWELMNSGEIPCVRVGRSVRYDPADLQQWIEEQKARQA